MAFNLQDFHRPCDIGFRVEVHNNHRLQNCTFDEHGNMVARNPSRPGDAQACRDHLLWQRPGGPFVSFFTNWYAALGRRQWMIEQGAAEVVIVVVWLKDLSGIYDAFDIAHVLGLEKLDKPDLFLYEVLIHGGISADSYRILAMFPGIKPTVDTTLCVPRMNMMVEVPGDFIVGVQVRTALCTRQLPDLTVKLGDEIYTHTGKSNDVRLLPLVLSMANLAFLYETSGTVITCPSAGLGWHIEAVV